MNEHVELNRHFKVAESFLLPPNHPDEHRPIIYCDNHAAIANASANDHFSTKTLRIRPHTIRGVAARKASFGYGRFLVNLFTQSLDS